MRGQTAGAKLAEVSSTACFFLPSSFPKIVDRSGIAARQRLNSWFAWSCVSALTSREEGSTVEPILLEKDFTMARTAVAGLLLLGLCISSTSAQEGVTLKKPEAKPKDPTSYAI